MVALGGVLRDYEWKILLQFTKKVNISLANSHLIDGIH